MKKKEVIEIGEKFFDGYICNPKRFTMLRNNMHEFNLTEDDMMFLIKYFAFPYIDINIVDYINLNAKLTHHPDLA